MDKVARITDNDLREILAKHVSWANGDFEAGEQAVFDGFTLEFPAITVFEHSTLQQSSFRNTQLSGIHFRNANLSQSNFNGAIMSLVDFSGAVLNRSKFNSAVLVGCSFESADVSYCDFTNSSGLLARQFAGANVTGAELPPAIASFSIVGSIGEAIKSSRRLLAWLTLGCAYAILTLLTTRDATLLNNASSSSLPLVGAQVPLHTFYLALSIGLLCIYSYLHFNLFHLWGMLAQCPAVFPDGTNLREKVYPWFVVGFAADWIPGLSGPPSVRSRLEWTLAFVVVWIFYPVTAVLLWHRFLTRRDPIEGLLLGGIAILAVCFGMWSHKCCDEILWRGRPRYGQPWRKAQFIAAMAAVAICTAFVLIYSIANMQGRNASMRDESFISANFASQDLAGADFTRSRCANGDFRDAFLGNAVLEGADLQGCDFRGAHLAGTNLRDANLSSADFRGVDLSAAIGIESRQYDEARTDESTIPPNFVRE